MGFSRKHSSPDSAPRSHRADGSHLKVQLRTNPRRGPWQEEQSLSFTNDLLDEHLFSSGRIPEIVEDFRLLTRVDDCAAIRSLITWFGKWVAFLPASEDNHHSYSFGLVDHSLGVAGLFLRSLIENPDSWTGLKELPDGERRGWILAGVAAALLHDCGKVLDMEVSLTPSNRIWDPMKRSLSSFLSRNATQPASEIQIKYLSGRGLKGHEPKGRSVIPVLLPSTFDGDLTDRTMAVHDACVSHEELVDPKAHWPAPWFAALILQADREDSANDVALQELMLVDLPLPYQGR